MCMYAFYSLALFALGWVNAKDLIYSKIEED